MTNLRLRIQSKERVLWILLCMFGLKKIWLALVEKSLGPYFVAQSLILIVC